MTDSRNDDDGEGERRKAEGMRRAAEAQDQEDPEWSQEGDNALYLTARMLEYFDADDVHERGI